MKYTRRSHWLRLDLGHARSRHGACGTSAWGKLGSPMAILEDRKKQGDHESHPAEPEESIRSLSLAAAFCAGLAALEH